MPKTHATDLAIYDMHQAADYCGLSLSGFKYHVHTAQDVTGRMVGHSLVFTQADLDAFLKVKRSAGRPKAEKPE